MLKWPNDLVMGDRKLAGLLTEVEMSGGRVDAVVLGVGCNCNWEVVPEELRGMATAVNLEAGRWVDRDEVLDRFLARLRERVAALEADPERSAREYAERLATIGRRVEVELPDRRLVGLATAVDQLGRLVVTPPDGVPVTVSVGDVVHLRAADHE